MIGSLLTAVKLVTRANRAIAVTPHGKTIVLAAEAAAALAQLAGNKNTTFH